MSCKISETSNRYNLKFRFFSFRVHVLREFLDLFDLSYNPLEFIDHRKRMECKSEYERQSRPNKLTLWLCQKKMAQLVGFALQILGRILGNLNNKLRISLDLMKCENRTNGISRWVAQAIQEGRTTNILCSPLNLISCICNRSNLYGCEKDKDSDPGPKMVPMTHTFFNTQMMIESLIHQLKAYLVPCSINNSDIGQRPLRRNGRFSISASSLVSPGWLEHS